MTLSARDPTLQKAGLAPPSVGNSDNNNNSSLQKHHASQQNHKASSSDRSRLHSMGSLMDNNNNDDEENQRENRPRSSSQRSRDASSSSNNNNNKKQPSSSAASEWSATTTSKKPAPLQNNSENSASSNNNVLATSSTMMMRQHRHRLLAGGQVAASILTPHNGGDYTYQAAAPAWDGLVRKGTKLKSFLDDALQHVATGYAVTNNTQQGTKRQRVNNDDDDVVGDDNLNRTGSAQHQHFLEREQAATSVAKDKTKEVLLMKQQLEEAQAQVAALTASNNTLREETTASSLRFERTIEALKISAANAACARTDADQAEASADGMSSQLEALKTVVEQTKQAAQILHEEQEEIAEQARNGQAKLLHVEAELARSTKETKQLREKATGWQSKTKELQEEATTIKRQLADEAEQSRKLTNALEERDALEAARKQRSQQVEKELRQAQALLVEASSQAADDETLVVLRENMQNLQAANTNLHEQIAEQEKTAREDNSRLKKSLDGAEEEAKQLRIEASLNNDHPSSEQDRNEDKSNNGNTAVSPDAAGHDDDQASSFAISTTLKMTTTPAGKDCHAVPPATTCSICFKAAFGLMKSCQCGRSECDKRVHLTCANKINPGTSVSHPGTPVPRLPIVLCSGALAGIITN